MRTGVNILPEKGLVAVKVMCKVSLPYLAVQRFTFIYIIYSALTLLDPLGYL